MKHETWEVFALITLILTLMVAGAYDKSSQDSYIPNFNTSYSYLYSNGSVQIYSPDYVNISNLNISFYNETCYVSSFQLPSDARIIEEGKEIYNCREKKE